MPSQTARPKELSNSFLSALITKLSGKHYPFKPGHFIKSNARVFFVDKENWVFQDSIVSKTLDENHLLGFDSVEIKTIVLIYSNTLPPEVLIDYKTNRPNKTGFQICFIDIDSMCIRKIVSLNTTNEYPESSKQIAQKIIQEF